MRLQTLRGRSRPTHLSITGPGEADPVPSTLAGGGLVPRSKQLVELLAAEAGGAQDVPERALLDRLVAVDGDGERIRDAGVAQDVVAAADSLDVPALAFESLMSACR